VVTKEIMNIPGDWTPRGWEEEENVIANERNSAFWANPCLHNDISTHILTRRGSSKKSNES
jgi:hypothetical protein